MLLNKRQIKLLKWVYNEVSKEINKGQIINSYINQNHWSQPYLNCLRSIDCTGHLSSRSDTHMAGYLYGCGIRALDVLDHNCSASFLFSQRCKKHLNAHRMMDDIYSKSSEYEKLELQVVAVAYYSSKNGIWFCDNIAAYTYIFLLVAFSVMRFCPLLERIGFGNTSRGQGHTFIAVNRNDKRPLESLYRWNDDAWILDLWSGFCMSIYEIKAMKDDFYKKHVMYKYLSKEPLVRASPKNVVFWDLS